MLKHALKIVQFIVFGNIFVSLSAASIGMLTLFVFHKSIELNASIILTFFSSLFIYNFQRVYISKEIISKHESLRHHWLRKHKKHVQTLLIIGFLGTLFSLFYIKPIVISLLIPLFLISYYYAVGIPFIRQKTKAKIKLREITGLKIFLVSFVWAVNGVYVTLLQENASFLVNFDAFLVFLAQFCFIFAITIPFDVRDMRYDTMKNIKTIPILLGVSRAKRLLYVILFFSLCLWLIALILVHVGLLESILFILIFSLICLKILNQLNEQKSEYYFAFFVESLPIIQFIIFLIVTILTNYA